MTSAKPLSQSLEKQRFARIILAFVAVFLGPIAACEPNTIEAPDVTTTPIESGCGDNTSLQTSLFGGIETSVSWSGSELECESMPRPDGQGIRLRLAGDVLGERLAFIVAFPELRRGQHSLETPANVTVTVEGTGRFFSTPGLESCWTEIDAQDPVPEHSGQYSMHGTLVCIAPLGEVNGEATLSIPSMTFATIVQWSPK